MSAFYVSAKKHVHYAPAVPRGSATFIHTPGVESPKLPLPFTPNTLCIHFSYSNISGVMSGPPIDASGVLTWKLLHFLAGQRPSAQEERGDRGLDYARTLARGVEPLINPSDLEIIKERIIL